MKSGKEPSGEYAQETMASESQKSDNSPLRSGQYQSLGGRVLHAQQVEMEKDSGKSVDIKELEKNLKESNQRESINDCVMKIAGLSITSPTTKPTEYSSKDSDVAESNDKKVKEKEDLLPRGYAKKTIIDNRGSVSGVHRPSSTCQKPGTKGQFPVTCNGLSLLEENDLRQYLIFDNPDSPGQVHPPIQPFQPDSFNLDEILNTPSEKENHVVEEIFGGTDLQQTWGIDDIDEFIREQIEEQQKYSSNASLKTTENSQFNNNSPLPSPALSFQSVASPAQSLSYPDPMSVSSGRSSVDSGCCSTVSPASYLSESPKSISPGNTSPVEESISALTGGPAIPITVGEIEEGIYKPQEVRGRGRPPKHRPENGEPVKTKSGGTRQVGAAKSTPANKKSTPKRKSQTSKQTTTPVPCSNNFVNILPQPLTATTIQGFPTTSVSNPGYNQGRVITCNPLNYNTSSNLGSSSQKMFAQPVPKIPIPSSTHMNSNGSYQFTSQPQHVFTQSSNASYNAGVTVLNAQIVSNPQPSVQSYPGLACQQKYILQSARK